MGSGDAPPPQRRCSRSNFLLVVIAVAVWATVVVMTVRLVRTHLDSGRKEKTSLAQIMTSRIEVPWVIVMDEVGTRCKSVMTTCLFSNFRAKNIADCNNLISTGSIQLYTRTSDAHILNQTHARSRDLVFTTPLDFLMMLYTVVREDAATNMTYPVYNASECRSSPNSDEWMNVMLLPIADATVIDKVGRGMVSASDLGTPFYAGLSHQSILAFSLSQEFFVDGRVTNKSSYKNTQIYNKRATSDPLAFEVVMQPDSFEVSQVKHLEGDSPITLLGGVFGWVGALTGSSIQGLLVAVIAFHQVRAHKAREKALGDKEDGLLPPSEEAHTEMSGRDADVLAELHATRDAMRAMQAQIDDLTAQRTGNGTSNDTNNNNLTVGSTDLEPPSFTKLSVAFSPPGRRRTESPARRLTGVRAQYEL